MPVYTRPDAHDGRTLDRHSSMTIFTISTSTGSPLGGFQPPAIRDQNLRPGWMALWVISVHRTGVSIVPRSWILIGRTKLLVISVSKDPLERQTTTVRYVLHPMLFNLHVSTFLVGDRLYSATSLQSLRTFEKNHQAKDDLGGCREASWLLEIALSTLNRVIGIRLYNKHLQQSTRSLYPYKIGCVRGGNTGRLYSEQI